MRKFADKQRTRWNSNTETTLSLSSVDTRGSWPIVLQCTPQEYNYIAAKFMLSDSMFP